MWGMKCKHEGPKHEIQEQRDYQIDREGQDRADGPLPTSQSWTQFKPQTEKKNAYPSLLYHIVLDSQDP